jgi:hypothetical protein
MHHTATVPRLGALTLLLTLLLAACSPSDDDPTSTPTFRLDGGYPSHQAADSDLSVIFGTPDLALGAHRIAFALSDDDGVVRLPTIELRAHAPDATAGDAPQLATATFAEFPLGFRGVYITSLSFDQPGEWQLEVTVPYSDAPDASIRFPITVAESTSAPDIGDPAPHSASRTLEDVDSLADLSSGANPDPALYATSIDRALDDGRPLIVVFASPGFCTNALCGPQAEVVSELRAKYPDAATYIHVDIYENPQQLREGDIDAARRTPLLEEWGLDTDEWTFIVDSAGLVTHRFESFAPFEELEPALLSVIAP